MSQPVMSNFKPPLPVQKPSLGRIVLVRTARQINGQDWSAAIVTQVWGDTMINVTVFPGSGESFTHGSIHHESHEAAGWVCWKWPDRV